MRRLLALILLVFLSVPAGSGTTTAATTELIVNGTFDTNLSGWSLGGTRLPLYGATGGYCVPSRWTNPTMAMGPYLGLTSFAEQTVTLTGDTELTFLTWGQLQPVNVTVSLIDEGVTTVLGAFVPSLPIASYVFPPGGGEPIFTCGAGGPELKSFPITGLGGHTVTIRFFVTSTGDDGTFAIFDDISILGDPPVLEATLTANPTELSADAQDETVLTLRATNTGEDDLTDVRPPSDLTPIGSAGFEKVSGPLPAVASLLAAGQSTDFTYRYKAVAGGLSTFVGVVSAQAAAGRTFSPVASSATLEVTSALLGATLNAEPAEIDAGEEFLVTLRLTNTGTEELADIRPFGELSSSGTASLSQLSGPLPASVLELDAGALQDFEYRYKAVSEGTATFSGRGEARGPVGAIFSSTVNSDEVSVSGALVEVTLTADPLEIFAGQETVLTLRVSNTSANDEDIIAFRPDEELAVRASTDARATFKKMSGPPADEVELIPGDSIEFQYLYKGLTGGYEGATSGESYFHTQLPINLASDDSLVGVFEAESAQVKVEGSIVRATLSADPREMFVGQDTLLTLRVFNSSADLDDTVSFLPNDDIRGLSTGDGVATFTKLSGPDPSVAVQVSPAAAALELQYRYRGVTAGLATFRASLYVDLVSDGTRIDVVFPESDIVEIKNAVPGSTALTAPAGVGSTTIEVASTDGFAPGDLVTVNDGESNEETHLVTGLGSLILADPLLKAHAAGETVTNNGAAGPDADGDGVLNDSDNCATSANSNQLDTDGDGTGDVCDPTPYGPPGTLTVRKVVFNDSEGGLSCSAFSFQIDAGPAVAFEPDCINAVAVAPGNHTVTEVAAAGYTVTYANSANAGLNCANLSVVTGVTCTITNRDVQATPPTPPACIGMTFDNTIIGTEDADTIKGTGLRELIFGLGGNDTISGGAGNDCIVGGEGNDKLSGGSGNDKLIGEAGNDTLNGDSGTDVSNGGTGSDACKAESETACES